MPFAHHVELGCRTPQWPSLCVRCGQTSPTSHLEISKGPWGFAGSRFVISGPTCVACRGALSRNWWFHLLLRWVIAALGTAAAWQVPGHLWFGWRALIAFGLSTLCGAIWRYASPPYFDLLVARRRRRGFRDDELGFMTARPAR